MPETAAKCPVTNKRKYPTQAQALSTASHQITTTDAPTPLRAYRCNWCHAWHLTKNEGPKKTRG